MNKKEFRKFLRECIEEVLIESGVQKLDKDGNWVDKPDGFTTPTPKSKPGKPPNVNLDTQWDDLKAGSKWLDDRGLGELDENEDKKKNVREMTGTSAVAGFYGKNWVDPDPERKKMKSIAAKSVGGKVT